MIFTPVDVINIISIFQLVIFVFFLFRKKSNRQANRILGAFLMAQLLIILDFENDHLPGHLAAVYPRLSLVGMPFILLAAPSFYLYVKSLAFSDFRLRRSHLLHTAPFVLAMIFFSFKFYFLPSETKEALLAGARAFPEGFWILFNLAVFAQLLVYFVADLRILKRYRNEIRERYSSISEINLSWISFILFAFIAAWLSSVVVFLSHSYFGKVYNELQFVNFFAFFLFFNYIFYKGLVQPELFSGLEEKPKYVSSKLTEAESMEFLTKLTACMENEKPFLNPDLTLKDLGEQLQIPARYLSQVINERTHQNFYDYVSQHRIEEAKRIFSDPSNDKTVLEVLYEVGFNSKSSFNTAFKKFTGSTPTHFRKGSDALTTSG
jgi:AraC-like DNA-binding protein